MAIPLILLVAATAACGGGGPKPAEAKAGGAAPSSIPPVADEWARFRETYPFHVQGVALSPPATSGARTLIVAEPPPTVSLDDLREVSPIFEQAEIREHRVGHDGWTKDVVATLPAGADDTELLTALHRLMFGTTYKAELLPVTITSAPPAWTEVTPSPVAIAGWFAGNEQQAVSYLDESRFPVAALLDARRAGVYRVDGDELVLWVLPRNGLDDARRDARIFAVESDLILGGVTHNDVLVLVARARALPIDRFPPLRFESLQALASVKGFEVGQSFERTSPGAGKMLDGNDFAPIYLSPEIIDTEIGSVLNITDQLLKSWSENGEVRYVGFQYPEPRYPLDQPMTKAITGGLTYNWNTDGFAAVVELTRFHAIGFTRTGALSVTYLPEGVPLEADSPAVVLAERFRDGVAKLGDPWLIRANQYAAAYHLLRLADVETAAVAPAAPPKRRGVEVVRGHIRRAIDAMASADLDTLSRRIAVHMPAQPTDEQLANLTILELAVVAGQERFAALSPSRRDAIAKRLADPGAAKPADDVEEMVALLHEFFIDRETLMSDLVDLAATRSSGWIRTPSVVVSTRSTKDGYTGGHNVTIMPKRMRATPGIPEPVLTPDGVMLATERQILEYVATEPPLRSSLGSASPAAPTGQGWSGGTRIDHGDPVRMTVEKQATGYRVALYDHAGKLLHERPVATRSDALDLFEAHATSPRAIRELELVGFDSGARDAFVRSTKMRDAGRIQVSVRGKAKLDLDGLAYRYDFKSLTLAEPILKDREAIFEVTAPAREAGKPGLVMRVIAWFGKKLPPHVAAKLRTVNDRIGKVLARWRGGSKPQIDVLAAEIRRELRAVIGDDPALRIEIVEGPDGTLIVKVTSGGERAPA
jgi:hypothetical protein